MSSQIGKQESRLTKAGIQGKEGFSLSTNSRSPITAVKNKSPYEFEFDFPQCHSGTNRGEQLSKEGMKGVAVRIECSSGSATNLKKAKLPEVKEVDPQYQNLDGSDSSDDSDGNSSCMPEVQAPLLLKDSCTSSSMSSDIDSSMEEFSIAADHKRGSEIAFSKNFSCEDGQDLEQYVADVDQPLNQNRGGVYVTDVIRPEPEEEFEGIKEFGNQLMWVEEADEEDSDILEHLSISGTVKSSSLKKEKKDSIGELPSHEPCWKVPCSKEPSKTTIVTRISRNHESRKNIAPCSHRDCGCQARRTQSQPRRPSTRPIQNFTPIGNFKQLTISYR